MESEKHRSIPHLRHLSSFDEKNANVLVLYTGGTIGMHQTTQGLMPRSNMAAYLKELPMLSDNSFTPNKHRKQPDISQEKNIVELVMPVSEYGVRIFYHLKEYELKKDSSNMDMNDWVDIALDVKNNYDKYDSFVILHGTDTMSYTASVLSFMFQNLDKTVILTGSQVPIFEQRNDGRDNLLGALMIAGHFIIPEVTLFFDGKLYRGNRTTKINSGDFQAFDSPNLHPLATLKVKIEVHWDAVFRGNTSEKFEVHTELNRNVGVLRLFPGITETTVKSILRPPMQGIVLETFGAGNCPSNRTGLIQLLKDAIDRGVIIINCTQCLKGAVMEEYECGKVLENIGVLSGSDITPEAALTKLSYVLGRGDISFKEKKTMMRTNLRGEMTVAVTESQFSLKDGEFIQTIASTLRASSIKEMHYIRKAVHPLLLCSAAQSGQLDVVDELCKKGNVDCCLEHDQRTALHFASAEGNLSMVKMLLQHGASLHKIDKYGATPLLDAVRFNRKNVISFLRQSGAHIGPITMDIAAEICVAAGNDDVASLEAWYLAGIDFNQVRNPSGRTPLHEAVCALRKDAVDYLLSRNIDVATKDNLGNTASENAIAFRLNNKDNEYQTSIAQAILNSLEQCEKFKTNNSVN